MIRYCLYASISNRRVLAAASPSVSHEGKDSCTEACDEGEEYERSVRLHGMASVLDGLAWGIGAAHLTILLVATTVHDVIARELALDIGLGAIDASNSVGECL